MSLTYSPNTEIGKPCPSFSLKDVFSKTWSNEDFTARGLCVMFICNHCPYVKAIEDRLLKLASLYKSNEIQFVAICSNDSEDYPEDQPEALKQRALDKKYPFPYLIDEDQSAAKKFEAVCTPDLFLYNGERTLFYRGRLDDSWKDASKVKSEELKMAMDQLLKNGNPPQNVSPSMGCSIKWKA